MQGLENSEKKEFSWNDSDFDFQKRIFIKKFRFRFGKKNFLSKIPIPILKIQQKWKKKSTEIFWNVCGCFQTRNGRKSLYQFHTMPISAFM